MSSFWTVYRKNTAPSSFCASALIWSESLRARSFAGSSASARSSVAARRRFVAVLQLVDRLERELLPLAGARWRDRRGGGVGAAVTGGGAPGAAGVVPGAPGAGRGGRVSRARAPAAWRRRRRPGGHRARRADEGANRAGAKSWHSDRRQLGRGFASEQRFCPQRPGFYNRRERGGAYALSSIALIGFAIKPNIRQGRRRNDQPGRRRYRTRRCRSPALRPSVRR